MGYRMKHKEIIEELAHRSGINRLLAEHVYENMIDILREEICAQETVILGDLGRFHIRIRPTTAARNPRTGEPITVPERKTAHFRCSKRLQELLAQTLPDAKR